MFSEQLGRSLGCRIPVRIFAWIFVWAFGRFFAWIFGRFFARLLVRGAWALAAPLVLAFSLTFSLSLVACERPALRHATHGARPTNPLAQPTIIVPHPTRGIVRALMHLRLAGHLPRAHYIFLVHKHQRYQFEDLAHTLRHRGFRSFEIITLSELPTTPALKTSLPAHPGQHPDAWVLKVRLSSRLYLPERWKRIFGDIVARADGVIIPGGGSIPAPFYRANQFAEHLSTQPVRALFELSFLRFLLEGPEAYLLTRPRFLLVGLCHGHQLLNVALGGTLYQSIPAEVYGQRTVQEILDGDPNNMHRNYRLALYPSVGPLYRGWFHPIRITGESRFYPKLERPYVLSNHHQAVRHIGRDLQVVALSEDGRVIEGIQHRWFPHVVGIQGHPEYRFAWERLKHFGPGTRAFHRHFWRQIREVIEENHRARRRQAKARGSGA